jgi:hypothetical protein
MARTDVPDRNLISCHATWINAAASDDILGIDPDNYKSVPATMREILTRPGSSVVRWSTDRSTSNGNGSARWHGADTLLQRIARSCCVSISRSYGRCGDARAATARLSITKGARLEAPSCAAFTGF